VVVRALLGLAFNLGLGRALVLGRDIVIASGIVFTVAVGRSAAFVGAGA
jgi:hypothetical protein